MAEFFVERYQIHQAFLPVNLATAANTGDWVSMANARRCMIVLSKGVGANGEDPTITVAQAGDAAGSDTKALTFTRIDKKQAATDLTSTGTFTKVTQTAAATYTNTDLGEQAAIIVIEIRKEDLDAVNGFKFIQASIADVGNTAQIADLLYIVEMEYHQETLPSILA